MSQFYIFDNTHAKSSVSKIRACEVASKLRLYTGLNYSEEDIKNEWNYDSVYPSLGLIIKYVSVKNIKWYINTYTANLIKDSEWNADFLMGMLQWGKIYYCLKTFPTFIWYGNTRLVEALSLCPYAGNLNTPMGERFRWSCVPALCFKYSSDTIDYMAGVLSMGLIEEFQNEILVKYNRKVGGIIREWGIPIEYQNKVYTYISPFWVVVLQNHMPKGLREKWEMVPKAYRAQEYSSILWKIYTGRDPNADNMPYVLSRRTIFNKYGSLRALRDLWIKDHLVELDGRFKKVVQEWQAKIV